MITAIAREIRQWNAYDSRNRWPSRVRVSRAVMDAIEAEVATMQLTNDKNSTKVDGVRIAGVLIEVDDGMTTGAIDP